MRYKVNDIDLSYQKDRNCDSSKIIPLNGVIDTPFSNKPFNSSFKEIFNSFKETFYLNENRSSLNESVTFLNKERIYSYKGNASSLKENINWCKETLSSIEYPQSSVNYLCEISIKSDKTFQYIIIHNWHNEYPDWFTKQW